jgi:Na+/phosphate symporter
MSLSETLMLMALGFALSLIIVMLVGRGLWSMAMRLGARRQAKNIPTAMLELQADRDRLRAEHAMMSRKLELRLEDIKTRMTEQMAEVSRHRNRVQSMMGELERRDETIKMRDREVSALNAQLEVHKADLSACSDAIEQLTKDVTFKDAELTKQGALIAQLSANLRDKTTIVSTLDTELKTALRLNDETLRTMPKSDNSENRLLQRVAELTSISTQLSQQHSVDNLTTLKFNDRASGAGPSRHSILDQQLSETEREATAMTDQLKAIDQMMNPAPAEPEQQKKSGAMANVISLAQRIRALQKGAE